ncbi:MAG: hypothetical protein IMX01_09895 [Limnochordaceae bacterium]|nr:hypothetical protein [Limnochordaceae bacterium]
MNDKKILPVGAALAGLYVAARARQAGYANWLILALEAASSALLVESVKSLLA